MPDTTEKTQWHPAFYDAMRAELNEYESCLSFITDRPLTAEPLKMDMLIIKKLSDVKIDKNFGRIFLRDNIIEYKAPGDSLSVNDYNKVFGYAYIYAYLEKLDIREITVTFVASAHPDNVIAYLGQRKEITLEQASSGILYVQNEIMPVQIITSRLLPREENLWLTSLTDKLKGAQFEKVLEERGKLSIKIGALLHAIAIANPEIIREESIKMGASLSAVLAEIGYVDRSVLEEEKKQIIMKAAEKIAKLAKDAEFARIEKERAEEEKARLKIEKARVEEEKARVEEEKARAEKDKACAEEDKAQLRTEIIKLKKNSLETAIDMLRHEMPTDVVSKWTSLPEDEILKLKADIDIPLS